MDKATKRLALPGSGNTKGGQGQHPISNALASDQDEIREGMITCNCKRWLGLREGWWVGTSKPRQRPVQGCLDFLVLA